MHLCVGGRNNGIFSGALLDVNVIYSLYLCV